MKSEKEKSVCYTIEREYLEQITVVELVGRIIQCHTKNNREIRGISHAKNVG